MNVCPLSEYQLFTDFMPRPAYGEYVAHTKSNIENTPKNRNLVLIDEADKASGWCSISVRLPLNVW